MSRRVARKPARSVGVLEIYYLNVIQILAI